MHLILSYLLLMIILGLILNFPLFFIVIKKEYLTVPKGIIAAAIVGISLFIINPIFWIVLCVFFFSSSILSKIKQREKVLTTLNFAKGSPKRDAMQVIANGFMPVLSAFAYTIFEFVPNIFVHNAIIHNPFDPFFIAVFVAFAVHNSDTWATEIGILSKKTPRLVTNLNKRVEPGTSGGITIDGCIASLLGSSLIAAVYLFTVIIIFPQMTLNRQLLSILLLIIIGGFLGSILDSIEGATIQGIYYCNQCKKECETNPHKRCGNNTTLSRGNKIINNDFVNLSSAFIITCSIILLTSML